jgi:hypothetical protein
MTIGLRWKRRKDGRMYFITSAAIQLPAHREGSDDETIVVKESRLSNPCLPRSVASIAGDKL